MLDLRFHVLTISDRVSAGEYTDTAGPRTVNLLTEAFADARVSSSVVSDGILPVREGILQARQAGARVIITLGGTGVAPRDLTPEASLVLINRDLSGLAQAIRQAGAAANPMASMSRGVAGIIDADEDCSTDTLLVNLAGSIDAAEVGCGVLIPVLAHTIGQLDGVHDDNPWHRRTTG